MYFFFENPGFWVKVELFWVVSRFKTSREHAIPWLYEGGEHIIFSVLHIPLRWWGDRYASINAPSHMHNTQKRKRKDRMAAKLCLTIYTKMRASVSHGTEQLCTDASKNHRPRCHNLVLSKWHIMSNEKSIIQVLIYFRFPDWQSWWIFYSLYSKVAVTNFEKTQVQVFFGFTSTWAQWERTDWDGKENSQSCYICLSYYWLAMINMENYIWLEGGWEKEQMATKRILEQLIVTGIFPG